VNFLFDYSKFTNEKRLIDPKIQIWQSENILSSSNKNYENMQKRVFLI